MISLNEQKTKSMFFNLEPVEISKDNGKKMRQGLIGEAGSQDFKYLDSWIMLKK